MEQGAQSKVSLYADNLTEKRVLKKIYTSSTDFANEVSALSCIRSVSHPLLVYPVCTDPMKMILVLEWAGDGDLTRWDLFKDPHIPYTYFDAVSLSAQVIASVAASHRRGILHGDVKPENFVVDLAKKRLKLIDFGLSSRLGDFRTMTQGTPQTMAPEVAFFNFFSDGGRLENRAYKSAMGSGREQPQYIQEAMDWWSVGVTIHYLMAKYFNDVGVLTRQGNNTTTVALSRRVSKSSSASKLSSDNDSDGEGNISAISEAEEAGHSDEESGGDDHFFPYKLVWDANRVDILDFKYRPIPDQFPPELADLIDRLMAWNPKDRNFRGKSLLELVNHPFFNSVDWYEIDPQLYHF